MKVALVLGVVLFAIFAGGVDSKSSSYSYPSSSYRLASHQDQDPAIPNTNIDPDFQKFQRFVQQYSKKYSNIEEFKIRFNIFKKNLREVDRLNAQDSSAKYGINDLSDRTQNELKGRNGLKGPENNDSSSSNDNYNGKIRSYRGRHISDSSL